MEMDPELFGRVLVQTSSADPGDLIGILRRELRRLPGALDLSLHLIDYRLASLRPVESGFTSRLMRPQPVDGSVPGEAYRTQQTAHESVPAGQAWHVPISVRGQRLGVLTGTFAHTPSAAARTVLRSLALVAAHAILEMSAGTDLYEISRRHAALSLAAEMQWQLLPARAFQTSDFQIAGHLEPALRVAGDAYDFAINDEVLTAVVVDAAHASTWPSGLSGLVVTALRNARRSGLPLAEQASLANEIVWQHSRGAEHASAVMVQVDASTRRASVVDAGSPPILRFRDSQLTTSRLEPQTPLGMFEDTNYAEQPLDVRAGDRLYILSDGAFEGGRSAHDLIEILHAQQEAKPDLPPSESIRRLASSVTDGGEELDDDITLVCVDWLSR